MRAGGYVDQLASDTDPIAALAHRAFEHVAHAKLAPDLLHIDGLSLVGEGRIAGDHEQPGDAGKGAERQRREAGEGGAPLTLPDKPSIAVLPFANMSGDPEQEYFADGMVEDITTALSKIRWFFVIARNSSFTYKGRAVDVTQVGRAIRAGANTAPLLL